jgi:UDP-N-acetylglucosamine 2-epimerase (non-hydrolysing)
MVFSISYIQEQHKYQLFENVKPDVLIILGDTHSGLSVLPASHYDIKIFHIEARLRAWDK